MDPAPRRATTPFAYFSLATRWHLAIALLPKPGAADCSGLVSLPRTISLMRGEANTNTADGSSG